VRAASLLAGGLCQCWGQFPSILSNAATQSRVMCQRDNKSRRDTLRLCSLHRRALCTITELLGAARTNQCCTGCPAQDQICTAVVPGAADNPEDLPSFIPTILHSSASKWLQRTVSSFNTGYCNRVLGWANRRVWGHKLPWRSVTGRQVEPGSLHCLL